MLIVWAIISVTLVFHTTAYPIFDVPLSIDQCALHGYAQYCASAKYDGPPTIMAGQVRLLAVMLTGT